MIKEIEGLVNRILQQCNFFKLSLRAVVIYIFAILSAAAQDGAPSKNVTIDEIMSTGAFANSAYMRGIDLLRSGDTLTAITMLELALDRAPDQLLYRQTLAEAYLGLQTETGVVMALEQFTTIVKQSPANRSALAGLVQSAVLLDRPVLAIETLERQFIGSGGKLDMSVLTDLAALYLSANMADRGITTLNRALPRAKDSVAIQLILASFYQVKGNMDKAKSTLIKAENNIAPGSAAATMMTNLKKRWRIE